MSLDAKIKKIIEEPLRHLGFELVHVRFVDGGQAKLEVLIERMDMRPITVEDCAQANRTISTHLDVEDLIRRTYILEVSSAGIDRPLLDHKDYVKFIGYKVFIQTIIPIFGAKKFRGFLEKVSLNHIYIRSDVPKLEELVEISFVDILKGKLDLDYMIELKMNERKEQK